MAVIWRFRDGKVGHERQTAGLIQAMQAIRQFDVHEFSSAALNPYWRWITKSFPTNSPKPDLILGAGSACQAPMLAAQHTHGGKSIYLMRPQFPISCFDLCIIPTHDSPPSRHNVLASEGVLNDLSPAQKTGNGQDMILIGGPSKHHRWDTEHLVTQIRELVEHTPGRRFLLSTSRRTPVETIDALGQIEGLDYHPFHQVKPTWLPGALRQANAVWVTADSISMMYESLSVGANLGILEVPCARDDRITKVATTLVSKAYATGFLQWKETRVLKASPQLNESVRCAELIKERFKEIFHQSTT